MSVPELHLRFWYDPAMSGPHFHVVRNATCAFVYIGATKEAAEGWAAERNSAPLTYGDVRDRLFGKSLVESMRDHQGHTTDAFRYMMDVLRGPPPPPRPWLERKWRDLRWWLSCHLRDLSDWIRP